MVVVARLRWKLFSFPGSMKTSSRFGKKETELLAFSQVSRSWLRVAKRDPSYNLSKMLPRILSICFFSLVLAALARSQSEFDVGAGSQQQGNFGQVLDEDAIKVKAKPIIFLHSSHVGRLKLVMIFAS